MAGKIEEKVEEEKEPSRKFPLKWVLIGIAVIVLAGGGYVGWSMIGGSGAEQPAAPDPAAAAPAPESPPEAAGGQIFSMDPFVVNLSEPGGKRYLKAKIELEFAGDELKKELNGRLPQLRDLILLHLSSKALEEIQSVDGKIELKNALTQRINQVLKSGKIQNLYFTQFVIQ